MKVAIIGSGQIARIHCRAISMLPNAQIVGVADKDLVRAKNLAIQVGATQFYQDIGAMISEQNPDIVHVLTPPQYHAELSIKVMNQGCHVLVEKPLALTPADAREMFNVAIQNNVYLCVDHNFLFTSTFARAIKLASAGLIGKVVSVEALCLHNPKRIAGILEEGAEYSHWVYRLNGGPLQDLMPHPASLVVEFLDEIDEVRHIGHNRGVLPSSWYDEVRVLVKSKTVLGYISISLSERPDEIALTIKGTEGTIRASVYNNSLTLQRKTVLPRSIMRGLSGFQIGLQNLRAAVTNVYEVVAGRVDTTAGIQGLISKLYEVVQHGGEVPVSLDKSVRVVDLIAKVWPTAPTPKSDNKVPTCHWTRPRTEPTALVTGASGFIGSHLVKKLMAENIRVRAFVRSNSLHSGRLRKLDVDIVEGDLTDAGALHKATCGIKTIYHVGAAMTGTWEDNYNTTIKGTEYLVKAALTQGTERLVHVSSVVVYELLDVEKNSIIKENTPYQKNPRRMGPYSYAKTEAEKIVFDAYQTHGLRATVVRPGMVIGPWGRVFFPHFGYRLEDKLFIVIGEGDINCPFTYVENTVDGIYKASIEDKAIGEAYNLVDDGVITAKEYLQRFIETTGIEGRIISVPYLVPYVATTAYEIASYFNIVKKGKTSRAQLKWKQAKVLFDNTKAKTELRWTPRIPLEEGLTRTFKWYASQNPN